MQGFPKHLNTKQDYLNTLTTMPDETRAALQAVFENRFSWQPVKKLKDSENPKQTATKEVREIPAMGPDMEERQTERWLYEYREDPNAWFFRLGFTVEEAENILNAQEA